MKYQFTILDEAHTEMDSIAWGKVADRAELLVPQFADQSVELTCVQHTLYHNTKTGQTVSQAKLGPNFTMTHLPEAPPKLAEATCTQMPLSKIGSLPDWAKAHTKGVIHQVVKEDGGVQIAVLHDSNGNTLDVRLTEQHGLLDLDDKERHIMEVYNATVSRKYQNLNVAAASAVCISDSKCGAGSPSVFKRIAWAPVP